MALGFIKKIFTFGKDTATEPKPEAEAPVAEQQAVEPQVIEPAPEESAAASAPLSVDEERDALLEEA